MVVVPSRRNQRPYRRAAASSSSSVAARVLADGGADAAAGGGDLGVSCALAALLEFGGAIAGEDRVGVGVDESGHARRARRRRSPRIRAERAARSLAGARRFDDAAVFDQHRAVGDDRELAQFWRRCAGAAGPASVTSCEQFQTASWLTAAGPWACGCRARGATSMASSYPASAWRITPSAGIAGQHALQAALAFRRVPSATTTIPACCE